MPKPLDRSITLVFGQTGTGKSQYTKRLIKKSKRVIVIDPQVEYDALPMCDDLTALAAHINGNPRLFRVRYSDLRDFDAVCDIASQVPETLLIVEESQRIIPPNSKLPPAFENLVYRGRHSGTSIHLIAQRPTTVNIAVRSQYHEIISFRQTEKRDIGWITDVTGFEVEDDLKNLAVLEYVRFNRDGMKKEKLQGFVK